MTLKGPAMSSILARSTTRWTDRVAGARGALCPTESMGTSRRTGGPAGYPHFSRAARGSRIWDVNGDRHRLHLRVRPDRAGPTSIRPLRGRVAAGDLARSSTDRAKQWVAWPRTGRDDSARRLGLVCEKRRRRHDVRRHGGARRDGPQQAATRPWRLTTARPPGGRPCRPA